MEESKRATIGCCPHCGKVIEVGSVRPAADVWIERYYRRKAMNRRITLGDIATESGYSEKYLRQHKIEYDRAGKWGAKKKQQTVL